MFFDYRDFAVTLKFESGRKQTIKISASGSSDENAKERAIRDCLRRYPNATLVSAEKR